MVVTFSDFKDREEVRIMEAFEVALRKNIASNFVHGGGAVRNFIFAQKNLGQVLRKAAMLKGSSVYVTEDLSR